MHGLLHDDMGVYKEDADGNRTYNWQYVDKLYDALLRMDIEAVRRAGLHAAASWPAAARRSSGGKGNVTPPKSYEKWGALITRAVRHSASATAMPK